jgi:hypothetical protein
MRCARPRERSGKRGRVWSSAVQNPQAVPELAKPGHYELLNPRAVFVTPKNVAAERFNELVDRLRHG